MKFMKKLSLFIMFLAIGAFFSKDSYSKEKSSNSYYEYTTEKIKIYSDENKKENIGTLIKGTRVNVYDTKEIIKKSKDKKGKEIEKKTVMKKITYKDVHKTKVVWIEDGYLISTLNEAVDQRFKNLDFTKKEEKRVH